jgi:hypothetical protein
VDGQKMATPGDRQCRVKAMYVSIAFKHIRMALGIMCIVESSDLPIIELTVIVAIHRPSMQFEFWALVRYLIQID